MRLNDLDLCRMIRTWEFVKCVLAYSVTHPDDPRLPRMIRVPPEKKTQRSLSGVGVYIPLHPLPSELSHPDQPRLQNTKSSTSLHPRA